MRAVTFNALYKLVQGRNVETEANLGSEQQFGKNRIGSIDL